MRRSRELLAARVTAKVSADLWPHPVLTYIAAKRGYSPVVRALAAAVTRVELEQRGPVSRLIEYAYVALRLPKYPRVTVGPGQMRMADLWRRTESCSCDQSECRIPPLLHCLGTEHQARTLLAEIARLYARHGSAGIVANAYHKGEAATDLGLETVYSRVVVALTGCYLALARPATVA